MLYTNLAENKARWAIDKPRVSVKSERVYPWLTLFTNCYKRPEALKRNQAVLQSQTSRDYEQICIYDDVGRGMEWVGASLEYCAPMARGIYVMRLADDDELAGTDTIARLREFAIARDLPEIIIAPLDFVWSNGKRSIIPGESEIHNAPLLGHWSGQNLVVRNDIYQKHAPLWVYRGDGYEYEINWLQSFFDPALNYHVETFPDVVSRMQYRGLGRTEAQMFITNVAGGEGM